MPTHSFFPCRILGYNFIPPEEIFSASTIYSDDYPMHYAQCIAAKRLYTGFGKCWGYDPFLLAGFPRCAWANADNKAWELFFLAVSPMFGPGFAFKLYLILFLVAYPFFAYGAARNFNLSRETGLAAATSRLFFHLSLAIDLVRGAFPMFPCVFFLSSVFPSFLNCFRNSHGSDTLRQRYPRLCFS